MLWKQVSQIDLQIRNTPNLYSYWLFLYKFWKLGNRNVYYLSRGDDFKGVYTYVKLIKLCILICEAYYASVTSQ